MRKIVFVYSTHALFLLFIFNTAGEAVDVGASELVIALTLSFGGSIAFYRRWRLQCRNLKSEYGG